MADNKKQKVAEPIRVDGGIPMKPSRELQVALLFEIGKYGALRRDGLEASFIFKYHVASLEDLIRKGLVEFSLGDLRLSSVGCSLYNISFKCRQKKSKLHYDGLYAKLKTDIDNISETPAFHHEKHLAELRSARNLIYEKSIG